MRQLLVLLIALTARLSAADLPFLHPLFADHCVLQRDRVVPVWGWTAAGAEVTVTIAEHTASATAGSDGRWEATLPALPAGGPHTLTVSGPETVTITDVLIGEVWICSGQSNMEQGIRISRDAEAEIAAADHPLLRLCWVKHHIALEPKAITDLSWATCTPATIASHGGWGGFSAVAYHFGREMQAKLGVPVGLIHSSWGGTPAQSWVSAEGLAALSDFAEPLQHLLTVRAEGGDRSYPERLETWWNTNDLGTRSGCMNGDVDDSTWANMDVPGNWEQKGLPNVDGVVWFRRSIEIPAAWEGREIVLSLGPIDDQDTTYLNGRRVGATQGWNTPRRYMLPAASAGTHQLALRVLDTGGGGGFHGQAGDLWIGPADVEAERISLAGAWRYQRSTSDGTNLARPPVSFDKNPHVPSVLSNGMIEPLVPFACAGAIWYQGEANAGNPGQYRVLLPALIADWRRRFRNPQLGFGIVQLASFMDRVEAPIQEGWSGLREAQAHTARNDDQAWLAVAIDIGEAKDIHPKNKQDVGKRLALGALATHHNLDLVAQGPDFAGMTIEDGAVRISFTGAEGLTTTDGAAPLAFAIAGPDGTWHKAEARIEGNTVVLRSAAVSEPRAVRYAWANNPAVNLVNGAGLPAVPFRSDGP